MICKNKSSQNTKRLFKKFSYEVADATETGFLSDAITSDGDAYFRTRRTAFNVGELRRYVQALLGEQTS